MNNKKHQYAPGTRAARLLQLRDALLLHEPAMGEVRHGVFEMTMGMFVIQYTVPHPVTAHRLYNVTIFQSGAAPRGFSTHGDNIASFSWSDRDEIFIHAFNNGEWENELLRLLTERGERELHASQ